MEEYQPILTTYIEAGMTRAEYEQREDGAWFGRIPGLQGLWANCGCHED